MDFPVDGFRSGADPFRRDREATLDFIAKTIPELAARHRIAVFDGYAGETQAETVSRLAYNEIATGHCRMAGGVLMLETRPLEVHAHIRSRRWYGMGTSGVYRVGESGQRGADYDVAAAAMDGPRDDWDCALPLLEFSMCESETGAPIARILRDYSALPDPAVCAAAEEIRDAQLELATQAVAACDLSPDFFKVRKDNPLIAAANASRWLLKDDEEVWRSDRGPWDLDHHFAFVSAWRAMRRARPVSARSAELDHLARQVFLVGGDPTGRRRRAGAVLMFEAEPEAPTRTYDDTLWRGEGADGRHYRVEARVNGVGDVAINVSVFTRTRIRSCDERLHSFVLSESVHHRDLLVTPGHVDEASLQAIEAVFDAQLDVALGAIARHQAAGGSGVGAGTMAA